MHFPVLEDTVKQKTYFAQLNYASLIPFPTECWPLKLAHHVILDGAKSETRESAW